MILTKGGACLPLLLKWLDSVLVYSELVLMDESRPKPRAIHLREQNPQYLEKKMSKDDKNISSSTSWQVLSIMSVLTLPLTCRCWLK